MAKPVMTNSGTLYVPKTYATTPASSSGTAPTIVSSGTALTWDNSNVVSIQGYAGAYEPDTRHIRFSVPLNAAGFACLEYLYAADSDMEQRAIALAYSAHLKQTRKYTGEPYLVHLSEVVRFLKMHVDDVTEDQIIAAWLHDTLEDTDLTSDIIEDTFGYSVAQLVNELTEKTKLSDGNRAHRKRIECARLEQASPEAQTVKLADLCSNTSSIVQHDPSFAKVYIPECVNLFNVLTQGNQTLRDILEEQLNNAVEHLKTN